MSYRNREHCQPNYDPSYKNVRRGIRGGYLRPELVGGPPPELPLYPNLGEAIGERLALLRGEGGEMNVATATALLFGAIALIAAGYPGSASAYIDSVSGQPPHHLGLSSPSVHPVLRQAHQEAVLSYNHPLLKKARPPDRQPSRALVKGDNKNQTLGCKRETVCSRERAVNIGADKTTPLATNKNTVVFEAKQTSQEQAVGKENEALVILEPTADREMMETVIDFIEGHGGNIVHIFPPHVLIGSLPSDCEKAVLNQSEAVAGVYRNSVDPSVVTNGYDELAGRAVGVWNDVFANPHPQVEDLSGKGEPAALVNDTFVPPDLNGEGGAISLSSNQPTSSYMIGRVAVGIVLPESNGKTDPSTEDWDPSRVASVFDEIVAATEWWADLGGPPADLSFCYTLKAGVPIDYEPINRKTGDRRLWIDQAMRQLGFDEGDYLTRVRAYDNYLRDQGLTDWAFTIFVVDSLHDSDNRFPDGYFAYAYLGGPLFVMTYGNNGYGIGKMDAVAAHEMGHIFLALDQYYSAHMPCNAKSGWFLIENQNSQQNCFSDVPSIMRGLVYPFTARKIDTYAAGQIGWVDFNCNGVLDPVDPKALGSALYPFDDHRIDLFATKQITASLRGLAVAADKVASVKYRVNGGEWREVPESPFYGGSGWESFSIQMPGLKRGVYRVEVQVTDSKGRVQTSCLASKEVHVFQPSAYLPLIMK